MYLPSYLINQHKWILRWTNRADFVKNEKKIRYKKKNKIAIISLFYSSLYNIKKIATYVLSEKYVDDFDFIIINNSSNDFIKFEDELINNNIIVLTPIINLWTDWWYAIWQEYVIKNWYEYSFIIEDDVILLDLNTFSDVYETMNDKSIGFINCPVNREYKYSWYVQFACYPINFLKDFGVIDPRFFTRWWDGDWAEKIDKKLEKKWYKRIIVNKKHIHPYLKKNNWNIWWTYFEIRNLLWRKDRKSILYLHNLLEIFICIWSANNKIFHIKSFAIVISLFYAIKDFLLSSRDLEISLDRMKKLAKINLPLPVNIKEISTNTNKIDEYTKGLYVLGTFSKYDLNKFKWSKKLSDFFKNGMITTNINCPISIFWLLSKKIITINECNFEDNTTNIYIINNKISTIMYNLIKLLVSLIMTAIIYIIILFLVFCKFIYYIIMNVIFKKI